ncbi:hypothetical protein PCYB_006730 [Plasmodium cynomolgi strain B]|uniref:CYIR protein n=1 Tax=Plasmodium cynomolgi (strain B) TaxID=1120755 RepID=K6V0R1_PLACD|nr:hypothetical protein PCYB_006730 [Plasmodium cynomolgi strain B]GAB69924.1 hypothetical protein PCYB_006730 [Plasmodium cynomolgi strain B]
MDQLSMDIDKWKEEYPFLENVWTKYEEFEKPVEENAYRENYYGPTCNVITGIRDDSKYNDFCMKLIRNLGAYSMDQEIINPSVERCNNIYSWLYYLIMKYNIDNDFIEKCFHAAKLPNSVGVQKHICTYDPYENVINVADDMLKINIFAGNFSTIKNILNDKTHTYNCLGRKFLYECFNIYNKINSNYCSNERNRDTMNICKKLHKFKIEYDKNIRTLNEIPEEIRNLNTKVIQFTDKCSLNEGEAETVSDGVHSTSSSVPPSATTAFGTVAGVSTALALLYKV